MTAYLRLDLIFDHNGAIQSRQLSFRATSSVNNYQRITVVRLALCSRFWTYSSI